MTKDELIKNLAWLREEAGLESAYPINHPMAKFIMAVSERAKSEEREACAKVCDEYSAIGKIEEFDRGWLACAKNIAFVIRARGEA